MATRGICEPILVGGEVVHAAQELDHTPHPGALCLAHRDARLKAHLVYLCGLAQVVYDLGALGKQRRTREGKACPSLGKQGGGDASDVLLPPAVGSGLIVALDHGHGHGLVELCLAGQEHGEVLNRPLVGCDALKALEPALKHFPDVCVALEVGVYVVEVAVDRANELLGAVLHEELGRGGLHGRVGVAQHVERAPSHRLLHELLGLVLQPHALLLLGRDDLCLGLVQADALDVAELLDARGLEQAAVVLHVRAEHHNGLVRRGAQLELLARGHGRAVHAGDDAKRHALGVSHALLVKPLGHGKDVLAHRELGSVEDGAEHDVGGLGDQLVGLHLRPLDLHGNALLNVGEELIGLSVARDVVLPDEAIERGLHALAEVSTVDVDVIHHERDDVLNVSGKLACHPADEEEELQHVHVVGLKALFACGRIRSTVKYLAVVGLQR